MPNKLSQFWQELKRRKVTRVITIYAAAAFVILELTDIVAPSLGLPDWTLNFIIILLCAGFIITVIVAWIYDIHPEGGIVKTEPAHKVKSEEIPKSSNSWKIASYISFIVIFALIVLNIIPRTSNKKEVAVKSIAVLPFENMSDGDEFTHLGDAITDEIIMQLYKISAFEVRSRTSIMQYKNTGKGSPEIGRELNVNYLLEGSTQRYEDQVRIRVQLIHALDDDHIWGEVYEGEWKDIFSIQVNVAKRVAHEMKAILSHSEIERIESKPTDNIEAYNLYLQGRYLWNLRTKDDLKKSIPYFEEAIKLDPEFALAYSGLADSYIVVGEYGYYPSGESFQKARTAAIKAIELDYELAEAHIALAAVKRDYDWDMIGAEEEYIRAIEMNPDYPTAQQWYSEYLSVMGRHDEAIQRMVLAQKLDPLSPIIYSIAGAITYFYARQYDQAILQCQRALEIDNNYVYAHYALAKIYITLERYEEAVFEAKKAVLISGGEYKNTLAIAYARSGEKVEAEKILEELIANSTETSSYSPIAGIYLALGMKEQALDWLEKGLPNREFHLIHIYEHPRYDSLRTDPRFIELARKIGIR